MNLLRVHADRRRRGIGRSLVTYWEQTLLDQGYEAAMTSTQSDEDAQHFYRRLGYTDIGGFVPPNEPLEIILYKRLRR